jgi:hypothetical protein
LYKDKTISTHPFNGILNVGEDKYASVLNPHAMTTRVLAGNADKLNVFLNLSLYKTLRSGRLAR